MFYLARYKNFKKCNGYCNGTSNIRKLDTGRDGVRSNYYSITGKHKKFGYRTDYGW